jgi:uncharacterized membrane protein
MDERLSSYINTQTQPPPLLSERKIVYELARRRKRLYLVMLSLAGLLWAILFYWFSFRVGRQNLTVGLALLAALSMGYICAGCFAGAVIKIRKVSV